MPVASAFSPIAPPSASISRTICPFANPPIAGLQDIWPIVSKFWVSIKVRQPSRADASAASIPAWPLPTTITSYSVGSLNTTHSQQNSLSWQRQELRELEVSHFATKRCHRINVFHKYLSHSYLYPAICSTRGVLLSEGSDKLSDSRTARKAVRVKTMNKSALIAKAPPHVQYSTIRGCVFPRARLRLS